MTCLSDLFVFCLGCCVGSFLNVCIYRLPREMSLVSPPSHCPSCNERIRWYDNIPVLSWLSLRGLCRRCGVLISLRYLLVELLAGLFFLWVYKTHRPGAYAAPMSWLPGLGAHLVLVSALIAASLVDIERMVIPDEISVGGMYAGPLLCVIWPQIIASDDPLVRWLLGPAVSSRHLAGLAASVTGMAVGAAAIYAAGRLGRALFHKEAMGFGDVKLMGMVGAFIGWQGALLAFLVACVLGAVIGIATLIRRRDTHIPFGPYLAAGTVIVMLHLTEVKRVLWEFPAVIRSLF